VDNQFAAGEAPAYFGRFLAQELEDASVVRRILPRPWLEMDLDISGSLLDGKERLLDGAMFTLVFGGFCLTVQQHYFADLSREWGLLVE
jgi:hypothetical protein